MKKQKIGESLEKSWSKKTNGKVTIGSGNLWFDKEDVKSKDWLFQCKSTAKDHYLLNIIDLNKLIHNSAKTCRKWGFVIEFDALNFNERTLFVIIPLKYISSQKDQTAIGNYSFNSISCNKKQVKLTAEMLVDSWLNDKVVTIKFIQLDFVLAIISEIDFLKIIGVI